MCEEVFEIIVRAENRAEVLTNVGNSAGGRPSEVLYLKIIQCCNEYIQNEGHHDEMRGQYHLSVIKVILNN